MDAIIRLKEIKSLLKNVDVISAMEEGFIQYSNGNAIVPPVGEMLFDEPKGETHIKYGYIKNDEFSVIKVASGFYDNPKLRNFIQPRVNASIEPKNGSTHFPPIG